MGETARRQEHFVDHPKAECFARHKANCVGVHRQGDKAARRGTASDLVAQLKPPCNNQ